MVLIHFTLCVMAGVMAWMHPGPLVWILGPLALSNVLYMLLRLPIALRATLGPLAPCLGNVLARFRTDPIGDDEDGSCRCLVCRLARRGIRIDEPDPGWNNLASRQSYPQRKSNQI
jgi:hypothetical protein